MQKYRIKYGRTIWHNDQQYNGGDVVELSEELALHHAPNIEFVRGEQEETTAWEYVPEEDVERES